MTQSLRRVLLTGANGFIGKNLNVRLRELQRFTVIPFVRGDDPRRLRGLVSKVDAVVHLAGENRPQDDTAFAVVNAGLTVALCEALRAEAVESGRAVQLVLASSTQAVRDNAYGRSKLAAEQAAQMLAESTESPVVAFRFPGVFGKWCRPHYNSVVATFCHCIARGIPVRIDDPAASVRLAYVDDVVAALVSELDAPVPGFRWGRVQPEYALTVGELAGQLEAFRASRVSLLTDRVGTGLARALYATYVSYLPGDSFAYELPQYKDPRGVFVEMLKTPDCGQFSYFTAHPGITRGGHYHHSKSEKFLVIKGRARFRFRHLITDQLVEFQTSGEKPEVVDTIPGWAHDITNVGDDDLIVMLWANENFDRDKPDTVASKV